MFDENCIKDLVTSRLIVLNDYKSTKWLQKLYILILLLFLESKLVLANHKLTFLFFVEKFFLKEKIQFSNLSFFSIS